MREQNNPAPTGSPKTPNIPKNKTIKYKSTKIVGWIFSIALIIEGAISIFHNALESAPIPFKYDFSNTITLIILSVIFIIYIKILSDNSKIKSKNLIEYLLEDLKYLILPAGFIFALVSVLDLKWLSDFFGVVSAILGIFGVIKKPTNNHISIIQNISSDPQSQRHERTRIHVDNLKGENHYSKINAIQGLASIADEWLSDSDIPEEQAHKNGQNIINILCEYIRSSFPLAQKAIILSADTPPAGYAGDFFADQATFREEQEVRRAIFIEISKRISTRTKDNEDKEVNTLDIWSEFDFNFNQATIFYPLNNLTIGKCNFSSARFYSHANFNGTKFIGEANFKGAQFTQDASFNDVTFNGAAYFSPQGGTKTTFKGKANFNGTCFIQGANFNDVTFTRAAYFSPQGDTKTTFGGIAAFNGTHFIQDIYFSEATFTQDAYFLDAVFTLIADFTKTTFAQNVYSSGVVFPQHVYFVEAIFTQNVYFVGATFVQNASFAGATFKQNVDFSKATFTQAAFFHNAIFIRKANFNETIFKKDEPDFVVGNARAWFSVLPAQEDHDFSVHSTSKPIPPGVAELDGVERTIPIGTVLFNPDIKDENTGEYTHVSEPAK